MDRNERLEIAHDVAEELQMKIEKLPDVERAFVHIDYETSHKPVCYPCSTFGCVDADETPGARPQEGSVRDLGGVSCMAWAWPGLAVIQTQPSPSEVRVVLQQLCLRRILFMPV